MAKFPVDTAVVVRDLVWNNPGGTVTKTRGALGDVVDAPTMGTYDPRKAGDVRRYQGIEARLECEPRRPCFFLLFFFSSAVYYNINSFYPWYPWSTMDSRRDGYCLATGTRATGICAAGTGTVWRRVFCPAKGGGTDGGRGKIGAAADTREGYPE